MVKRRVHEIAKVLNISNKDIIDFIKSTTGVEKKHMSAMTEEEISKTVEHFKTNNNTSDINKNLNSTDQVNNNNNKNTVKKLNNINTRNNSETENKANKIFKNFKINSNNTNNVNKNLNSTNQIDSQQNINTNNNERRFNRNFGNSRTINSENLNNIDQNNINSDRRTRPYRNPRVNNASKNTAQDNKQSSTNLNNNSENKVNRPFRQFRSNNFSNSNSNATDNQSNTKRDSNNRNKKFQSTKKTYNNNLNNNSINKNLENKKIITNNNNKNNPSVPKPAAKIIDTRAAQIDIERYNEKYDRLASEKMATENVVRKQKITQKSQQRGKPRNSRKETEAERLRRIALERKNKPITISIPENITVGELASRLKATASEVIKKLISMGTMASINDSIDFDTASLVAMEFNAKVEKEVVITIEERIIDDSADSDDNLIPRAPVVVVMGHVDHGKTSLLDAIRHADVTSTEAGGITQHIGAYRVKIKDKDITFLDTPGHEAFTTMRARGAQVTDIAILVVAADDGIMPQTIEAINHAKAAGVSIIVAINKMDKPGANPEHVKQQLTEHEVVPEEWGGDTPCIPVSAKTHKGIDELLEMVTLMAEMKELKANPDRAAKGTVIEAKLDKGRGPIATVLVQNGTLNVGDIVIAGTSLGRVRAMSNERGDKVKKAGPSVPVEITGLDSVPTGGDIFNVVTDERLARELVEQRIAKQKEKKFNSQTKVTLDNLFDQMQKGEVKELKIIVKADVQGSVEAIKQSLEKLSNDEVHVVVIHGAVGAISESDVMLANASNAIIVGFNVRPDPVAAESAERNAVDLRLYRVIYDCIDEIASAMKGLLDPKFREVELGRAECRKVYKISNVGTIAGSYVVSGKISRNAEIRVVRDGIVVAEDKLLSLRRFKDDVKEVAQGYECGICLEKFNDIKEGDIFEAFIMEEYRDN